MRAALRILLPALLLPALAAADYIDPWGLPSGSGALALATQDAIQGGDPVEGYDFAAGEVLEASYVEQVAAGLADLLFVELDAEDPVRYLRAPEGEDGFDRAFIARLGAMELAEVQSMEGLELETHVEAAAGECYVLLQRREGEDPETTAVKFRLSALDGTTASFDWVWQPNGSLHFVPSAAAPASFSRLKTLW